MDTLIALAVFHTDTLIAAAAFFVSLCSFIMSLYFWMRASRPIVTVAVKTRRSGSEAIAYDLVVRNSGTIPAKNIRLTTNEKALSAAFGKGASEAERKSWIAAFGPTIPFLQNDDTTSCSFGTTKQDDEGFWKYRASFPITISYEGWFGRKHKEAQDIQIVDSESFTGNAWKRTT